MINGKYYGCIEDFINEASSQSKYFLMVAEYTPFSTSMFSSLENQICGVVVPFVIYDNEFFMKGLIACVVENSDDFVIVDLKNSQINKEKFTNSKSLIVMLDGLSPDISDFLDDLFESIPENTQIIGGGAGKMTFMQEPVIFSKDKFFENSALIISLNSKLHCGVKNGWEYLKGPFITTNSKNNLLKTLNFKNAFEIYRNIVEKDSNQVFSDDNFFDIAKSYPLGILKLNKEIVVRDLIFVDDEKSIVLVGSIPQNSIVNVLKGDFENLINSSLKNIKNIRENLDKDSFETIIFSGISRSIYLGDNFNSELNEIKKSIKSDKKMFGALTLGEIANNGKEYINFYNKTCVVGLLC